MLFSMMQINCCHFVGQNTMMLPNISFWYVVFQSRLLSKKLPGAFAQKKMVDSIPECSRILLTQMRPTV